MLINNTLLCGDVGPPASGRQQNSRAVSSQTLEVVCICICCKILCNGFYQMSTGYVPVWIELTLIDISCEPLGPAR